MQIMIFILLYVWGGYWTIKTDLAGEIFSKISWYVALFFLWPILGWASLINYAGKQDATREEKWLQSKYRQ